jgi:hypothetical protein
VISYEDNAEVECETAILNSLSFNPASLDGRQAMANLRLSQERYLDACQIMKIVVTEIMSKRSEVALRPLCEEISLSSLGADDCDGTSL